MLASVHHPAHAFRREFHFERDFFRGGAASEVLFKNLRGAVHLANALGHVQRNADRARLLRQRTGNRLTNPPRCVSAKAVAALVVVLIDGAHQANIAFLNEVREGKALAHIALGDAHDESGIGATQVFAGSLPVIHQCLELLALALVRFTQRLDLIA